MIKFAEIFWMRHNFNYIVTEFIINKFLKLKLENGKTIIFVDNRKVIQCKYLLLNKPTGESGENKVNSERVTIDIQAKGLDHSLEIDENYVVDIPPETEFWAHSSNLQSWYENSYDTEVLHSNLAFPLLKKLAEAGDKFAEKVFKSEIMKRFRSGNLNVMTFLIKEGFLDFLDIEDYDALYKELDFETYKKLQKHLRKANENKEGFKI